MPFKSLHSPRRVADVDAEVRATSVLTTAGLVAMLSHDPVRLAIQSERGGNTKRVELGFSQGDEVAFMTKDVLLVRSGDEVWAVLGIAHTPKVEQVARDAKALCMRPSGETALVLGWDGSATALTMGKDEIVARPFALRGDVRVADLGATEMAVVVDDGAGGELRIHPGATPEPGARVRAKLPLAAARHDRLRGGRELSVVFKRGGTDVCVVRQEGAGLAAKIVHLGAKVADACVRETSLFVALEDGRLALYDREALAAAGEAAIEPTATIALGARGAVSAMAVTGASVAALWIGTGSGEIFQISAARKSPL